MSKVHTLTTQSEGLEALAALHSDMEKEGSEAQRKFESESVYHHAGYW